MIKKFVALIGLLAAIVLCCACASAQSFTFRDISATLTVPDTYNMLTSDNLNRHEQWVEASGKTAEQWIEEWAEQGVLLVAENADGYGKLVVTAVQDDDAAEWYDLDQQTDKVRTAWQKAHLAKTGVYRDAGYTISSAKWKQQDSYGRFLLIKYKHVDGDSTYYGYAYKTIRNGYSIMLDYQVTGRTTKSSDLKALDQIMSSFEFISVNEKPATCVQKAAFTSVPPTETNTGSFSVEGTCDPGLTLTGVLMRMSTGDKQTMELTVGKSGKFSMDVQLQSEGVWLMTVCVYNGETLVQEQAFDVITYQSTLLPINLDVDLTADITTDTLTISGTTIRGVQIQCIVNDTFDKTVTTNGTGKFSFKVPTKTEGTYSITLTFQKKGFTERRMTAAPQRVMTQEYIISKAKQEAVKPAYSNLVAKLSGYTGRTMKYTAYVVGYEQKDGKWVITMAMDRTGSGEYKNLFVVTTSDEPDFTRDSKQTMYGTCTGPYVLEDEGGITVPSFELIFWD